MLKSTRTKKFDKSLVLCKKRGYDIELFKQVAKLIINETPLPAKYKAHKLNPHSANRWDCHIKGDWVLVYRFDYKIGEVIFEDTGTHSDLF